MSNKAKQGYFADNFKPINNLLINENNFQSKLMIRFSEGNLQNYYTILDINCSEKIIEKIQIQTDTNQLINDQNNQAKIINNLG